MFMIGVMTAIAPYAGGDPDHWEDVGERMHARLGMAKYPMDPARFEGRGCFGRYFAHQARGFAK